MEVSAFKHIGTGGVPALAAGRSPLLRLQSDERLVALIRRGHHGAFEVLVARYTTRLLSFCRHMLGSREDAEDVLQEVFTAAFSALHADDRPVNVRPWLYRIARNRSLNHLRRTPAIGVDSMDVHLAEHGISTADKVHRREEFRQLIADVGTLPETQRSALIMREMDNLSYEQISEAMETTIPSVKSLLVRARVGLAEAAEARALSCSQVRLELGEVAEGLKKLTPPVRRHLKGCDRCSAFRRQLQDTNKALAAVMPVGAVLLAKKLVLAHLGHTASGGGGAATAGAAGAAGGTAAVGSTTGGLLSAGFGALGTKAAVGLTAAALVTAGAVEVQVETHAPRRHPTLAARVLPASPALVPRVHLSARPGASQVAPHRPARAERAPAPTPPHRAPAAPPAAHRPVTAKAAARTAPSKPAAAVTPPVATPTPLLGTRESKPAEPAPTQMISESTTAPGSPSQQGTASSSGSASPEGGTSSGSGSGAGAGSNSGQGSGSGSGSGSPAPGTGAGTTTAPAPVPALP